MIKIGRIIISLVGLAFAVLLCAPLAVAVWVTFVNPPSHVSMLSSVSVGSYSFSGWQTWVVLGVLASLGGAIFVFSIYALTAKKDDT